MRYAAVVATSAACVAIAVVLTATALSIRRPQTATTATPWNSETERMHAALARFEATVVDDAAGRKGLTADQEMALNHVVAAARIIDTVFRDQVWAGNRALQAGLAAAAASAKATHTGSHWAWAATLAGAYVDVNAGPWSRLDANAPFLPPRFAAPAWGIPPVPPVKPAGANFYPPTATADVVEAWLASLAPGSPAAVLAHSPYSVIRRNYVSPADSIFTAHPYSSEYADDLVHAAALLDAAAALVTDASLAAFLTARAAAFVDDSYTASDVTWLAINVDTADFMVTIGPYETYEDGLLGRKAAFSANIGLIDRARTASFASLLGSLQSIEDALPIADAWKNKAVGSAASIVATNQVFVAGDSRAGVQTTAFNLPNSAAVTSAFGTRRVVLLNVLRAKFESILLPIAAKVLAPGDLQYVTFDAFLYHTLFHELLHGLGPHTVFTAPAPAPSVSVALGTLHSPIEEAKADIAGLWALTRAVANHTLPDTGLDARSVYTTFLASAFRSMRFGLDEAHGKAVATQFGYLSSRGAFTHDAAGGTFAVDISRMPAAVEDLAAAIMTLQARGDRAAAQALLDTHGTLAAATAAALDAIHATSIPVDILPLDAFTPHTHPLARHA